MVDASFSRQRAQEDRVVGVRRQLLIFAVGLAVILIGLGLVLLQRGFGGNTAAAVVPSVAPAAREQVSNELLETTKGLQVTQQQAVDHSGCYVGDQHSAAQRTDLIAGDVEQARTGQIALD